jgi:hypothetical protein
LEHQRDGQKSKGETSERTNWGVEQVDIVGIQETIKKTFSVSELENLAPGKGFSWKWVEAKGHSGGFSWWLKKISCKWRIGRLESFSWLQ